MIFLKKMNAVAKFDEPAIFQRPANFFCEIGRDQSAGLAAEQKLRIGRGGQRRMGALHRGVDIGGLAGDWQFARKRKNRAPRLSGVGNGAR